jgi:hypothetical protein
MSDVEDRLPRLMDRLDALKATYAEVAADEVNPTETGRTCLDAQAIKSVIAFLYPGRCADAS